MKINLDLHSESATKKQMANAEILFGKSAKKLIPIFESYSKEKLVDTSGLDALLGFLKSADPERVEKFANTKASANVKSAARKLSVAKQFPTIIAALKLIKPLKSYQSSIQKTSTQQSRKPEPKRLHRMYKATSLPGSGYMAYNHNDTKLMRQPGTKQEAEREAREYTNATGNAAYVDRV